MLYDNAFPSNYEEIKTYYPVWYRDIPEMDTIWQAMGNHLDKIQEGILTVIFAMFIKHCDEYAVRQWESFLLIRNDPRRTMEDRKRTIIAYFIDNGHIGEKEIRELLAIFTPAICSMRLKGGSILLFIQRDGITLPDLSDFFYILSIRIPAHLGLYSWVELNVDTALYAGAATAFYKKEILNTQDELKTNSDRTFPLDFFYASITTAYAVATLNTQDDLIINSDRIFPFSFFYGSITTAYRVTTLNFPDDLCYVGDRSFSAGIFHGNVIMASKEELLNMPGDLYE